MKTPLPSVLPFLAAAVLVPAAKAELIAYESFSYTLDATINGLNGGSGWDGAWSQPNVERNSRTAVVAGQPFGSLTASGNAIAIAPETTANAILTGRKLATALNSGTVYLGFLGQNTNSGLSAFALTLRNSANIAVENVFIGQSTGTAVGNWKTSITGNASSISSDVSTSTLALLVVKIEFNVDGANDRVSFGWSSNPGVAPSLSTTFLTGDIGTVDSVYISGGYNAVRGTTNTFFDEIRIGTTLEDVVPGAIPEPSSASLLLGGAAFLGVFAWRRRAGCKSS